MKKLLGLVAIVAAMFAITSCGGGQKQGEAAAPAAEETKTEAAAPAVPEYKIMSDLPTVDLSEFPKDADGKITLFDGKTFKGWRGYLYHSSRGYTGLYRAA